MSETVARCNPLELIVTLYTPGRTFLSPTYAKITVLIFKTTFLKSLTT